MREALPTHRGGRDIPRLKPQPREGVTMPNLIYTKEMFNEIRERDRKRLADAFNASFNDGLPVVLRKVEEVIPVAESCVMAKKVQVISDSGGRNEKGHRLDSRRCRDNAGEKVQRKKSIRHEEPVTADAPTSDGVSVVAADNVSEGTLITKDSSGSGHDT